MRRRFWSRFALAATAALAALGGATTPSVAAAGEPAYLSSAMTWNVKGTWDGVERWAAEIAAAMPGMIGLQEVCRFQVEELRAALAEWGLAYSMYFVEAEPSDRSCQLSGAPFGNLLLIDPRLNPRDYAGTKYPARPGGNQDAENRAYQAVTITFEGQNVRVFNTHMGLNGDAIWHIQKLAEAASPYSKSIVMGDFNTRSTKTAELAPLTNLGFKNYHFVAGGDSDTRHDLYDTFENDPDDTHSEPVLKIDHLFVRNVTGVTFDPHVPHWNDSSDHRALVLDMCSDC